MSDVFANMGSIVVTESAPNTLTFQRLETGIPMFEKVAWVICRIRCFFDDLGAGQFGGNGDAVSFGLTVSNLIAALDDTADPAVVWSQKLSLYREVGAPGLCSWLNHQPMGDDLGWMPGGGLIIPPTPLYAAVQGNGLVAAMTCSMRFWYTLKELKPDEYWELVESRRIVAG